MCLDPSGHHLEFSLGAVWKKKQQVEVQHGHTAEHKHTAGSMLVLFSNYLTLFLKKGPIGNSSLCKNIVQHTSSDFVF